MSQTSQVWNYCPRHCNNYSIKCSLHLTSGHWHMTYREGLSSWSGKGSLFPHPFFKTAMGWKTAAKTWGSSTSSASRRAWSFLSSLCWFAVLYYHRSKHKEKLNERQVQGGCTIGFLNFHQSLSGETSSESVFSFPFGLFLVHRESQNASLCC